jgi:ABC-type lipoprotein export system ATPase subunit
VSFVLLEGVKRRLGPGVEFFCPRLEVEQGRHTALWGPSGCGKTTLIHLIAGLLRPDAGTIQIQGKNITTLSPREMDRFRGEHIGLVFQTFNLLEPFTALQNVLLGMQFSGTVPDGEWRDRAETMLKRVGLGHRLRARARTLSAGEKQRVAIARAIVNRPALILADEPTGSLDPKNAQQVMDLLLEVCAEFGVTLLLVTHDRLSAERLPALFDCSHLVHEEQKP